MYFNESCFDGLFVLHLVGMSFLMHSLNRRV